MMFQEVAFLSFWIKSGLKTSPKKDLSKVTGTCPIFCMKLQQHKDLKIQQNDFLRKTVF